MKLSLRIRRKRFRGLCRICKLAKILEAVRWDSVIAVNSILGYFANTVTHTLRQRE
jgi:hypothetical protein